MLDYLRALKERGKTVIVSTHVMSEAQKLCDRIAIIIDGRLYALGTLEELEQQTNTWIWKMPSLSFTRSMERRHKLWRGLKVVLIRKMRRVFREPKMIFSLFLLPVILMIGIYGLIGYLGEKSE